MWTIRLFTLYFWLRWLWNIFNKSLGSFTINSSLLCYLCWNVHWCDSLDVVKHQKTQIQMILRNGYYLAILLKKPGNSNHEWQTERMHSWRSASASSKGGYASEALRDCLFTLSAVLFKCCYEGLKHKIVKFLPKIETTVQWLFQNSPMWLNLNLVLAYIWSVKILNSSLRERVDQIKNKIESKRKWRICKEIIWSHPNQTSCMKSLIRIKLP